MAFLRWPQINYLDFLSSDKEPVKARDACCLKVLKKKNTWDLAQKRGEILLKCRPLFRLHTKF